MNIIITTGGTGGHIYPALTIMERLKDEGHNLIFVGRNEGLEKNIIAPNYPYRGIDVIGYKGLSYTSFIAYKKYKKAVKELKEVIKKEKIDLVIGFGNYVSAPVVKAALTLKIKTIIHEQNIEFGKANLMFKNKVNKVLTSFDEMDGIFVGNPRSEEFFNKYKKKFHSGKNILIYAGSQGSEIFNKFLTEHQEKLNNLKCYIHFVTGKKHYEDVLKKLHNQKNIFIYDYIDNMIEFLSEIDICVTRAGASTIAELSAIGMPLILIPSPYVTNNHQYHNALKMHEANACILIKESDINDKLYEAITTLAKSDNFELKRNIKKFAKTNSIELFLKEVHNLMEE